MLFLILALLTAPADARDDHGRAHPARKHQPAQTHPAPRPAPKQHRAPARHRPAVKHSGPVRAHHAPDHRYTRPYVHHLPALPGHPAPRWTGYWGWHTHWWVHPWYRWTHATVAVMGWDWAAYPWTPEWVPPARDGWAWVPGHWNGAAWVPGHWAPLAPPPLGYVYVPGFWVGTSYIAGHWRLADRPGWTWVEAETGPDQVTDQGYWLPASPARTGWEWERGFWDGETWVEGFWRAATIPGYAWVSAAWDEAGVYHCGYWEPIEDKPGHVWIPGWFDGRSWVPGYWVTEAEVAATDTDSWVPPAGSDTGAPEGTAGPVLGEESPTVALPAE